MLIFIIFLSISYLAKKIWFVLVLYTEAVILLVYVWDALSAWTEPVQEEHSRLIKDIIGSMLLHSFVDYEELKGIFLKMMNRFTNF